MYPNLDLWKCGCFFKRRESQWEGAESAKENGKVEPAFFFLRVLRG